MRNILHYKKQIITLFALFSITQYCYADLTTNLKGSWSLNETTGDAVDDLGINTLTNTGGATYTTGKIDNGVDLEVGSLQYLVITDASQTGLDITDDISISAWVKFETLPTSGEVSIIMAKEDFGTPSRAYYFGVGNSGGTYTLRLGVNGTSEISSSFSPSTGTWYHLAVTRLKSTGNITFYVNGSPNGTDTNSTSFINSTSKFAIGGRFNSGAIDDTSAMDGMIDIALIYDRELSGTEITELYNTGTGLEYPFGTEEEPTDIYGCTDPDNENYNPEATIDNGSCASLANEILGTTFGLAIIITLLSIGFIAYFYNAISKRKPWKK